jgi:HEAT repeat protein
MSARNKAQQKRMMVLPSERAAASGWQPERPQAIGELPPSIVQPVWQVDRIEPDFQSLTPRSRHPLTVVNSMRTALRTSLCAGILIGVWALELPAQQVDVAKIAAGLKASGAQEQHAAADALADLGPQAQEAAAELVAALDSRDAQLRWRAARALGLIGSPQALDGLRKRAADDDAVVRAQAVHAIGRLKAEDQASLAAVVARLTDSDAMVRRAAMAALLNIKADRARVIPLVVKALEDADPAVVMPALHTLAEGGAAVVPALSTALEHKEARYWACLVLSEIGPAAKDAVPSLVKVVADERPEVRLNALVALAEIGPDAKAATPAAIKALDDSETSVRYGAAFALGRFGDSSAAAALDKATQSDDHFLRQLAVWSAAKVEPNHGGKVNAAVKLLVAALTDEHAAHRTAAARGLLELNQPELVSKEIDSLVPTLNDEKLDRFVTAFASLGSRVVPRATEVLKDPQRRERALRVLARIGPDAAPAVPEIVKLLGEGDAQTRTGALFTLAAIGPRAEAAVEPITKALDDSDREVKLTAGYALGKIGPAAKSAAPALIKLAAAEDDDLKLAGVWALLKVDPSEAHVKAAVPALAKALGDDHEFVRIEAAMTLGDLGKAAAGALPALEAAQRDRSSAVRAAAAQAVKKIKG